MGIFQEVSFEITHWLQENYPQLETFFGFISEIGEFQFYLIAIALVYWCLNKQLGRVLGYTLAFSYTVNSIIKHVMRDPRPYWFEPSLGLSADDSYGIPSGHAQSATVFYGLIAMWYRRAWVWIVAIIMILLMSLSRVYLGVHDLEDVLAGILVGAVILIAYYLWVRYLAKRFANRILGQRLLAALVVPFVLTTIYVASLLILDQPNTTGPMADFITAAEKASIGNYALSAVTMLGLGIGFILEASRVRFTVDGPVWRRAVRFVVGIVGTLVIYAGLGSLYPDEPFGLIIFLDSIRVLLVSIWIAYYAPWLFVRTRVADSKPEPEVSITP